MTDFFASLIFRDFFCTARIFCPTNFHELAKLRIPYCCFLFSNGIAAYMAVAGNAKISKKSSFSILDFASFRAFHNQIATGEPNSIRFEF